VILLDTHALIWLATDSTQLGATARRFLRDDPRHAIAAISCWEVARLAARGRIRLDREPAVWVDQVLGDLDIDLLPLTPAVAAISAQLDWSHRDPSDRLIVGTAVVHGAILVSKDEKIQRSGLVKVVW
jgi:PIN domain nuclease of toxin-antitoxin system